MTEGWASAPLGRIQAAMIQLIFSQTSLALLLATDKSLDVPLTRLIDYRITIKCARVARGIQHRHNDDRADLVTEHLRHVLAWGGVNRA